MLGDAYRSLLYDLWPGSSGNADYCVLLPARLCPFAYSRRSGLIATNTIAQGDTRQTGLAQIEADGGVIYWAANNAPCATRAGNSVDIVASRERVRSAFVLITETCDTSLVSWMIESAWRPTLCWQIEIGALSGHL